AAAPLVAELRRRLGERNQGGLGHRAGDAHVGGIAEVLLGEDGQVVQVDVALAAAVAGQPGRQAVPALAQGEAEAATGPAEGGRGAGAAIPAGAFAEDRKSVV